MARKPLEQGQIVGVPSIDELTRNARILTFTVRSGGRRYDVILEDCLTVPRANNYWSTVGTTTDGHSADMRFTTGGGGHYVVNRK